MDHDDVTARIDRRIARRAPATTERHFSAWERQWNPNVGRNKPSQNAVLFDLHHEQAMRDSMKGGQIP